MKSRVLRAALVAVGAMVALPCLQGVCEAQVFGGTFDIDGAQEVPPSGSTGGGVGAVILDTSTLTLSWSMEYSGLTGVETVAHFHGPAPAGANAGVQIPLPFGSPKVGSSSVTAGQAADIVAGLWYVNIHSTANPGGDIRGQVLVSPVPQVAAGTFPIDAAQEVPPNGSPATGVGSMVLNTTSLTLSWDITFSGLTGPETVAHLHGPAPPGANAGVQVPLALGSPKLGSAVLTPVQAMDVLNGLWYVNIHSVPNPGGEIRGQVLLNQMPVGFDLCNGDSGDGAGCTDCPCLNNAPLGTLGGCLNSAGTSARLTASGSTSASLPPNSVRDLRFGAQGAPPFTFCVLLSGDAVAPTVAANPCFGLESGINSSLFDGLRCVVMVVRRHGGRAADAAGDVGATNNAWGGEAAPPIGIAATGPFGPGQTRYFQFIYRDFLFGTCTTGLNTSQAVRVTFTP